MNEPPLIILLKFQHYSFLRKMLAFSLFLINKETIAFISKSIGLMHNLIKNTKGQDITLRVIS